MGAYILPRNPAGTESGTRREPLDDSRQEDGPPSHRAQAVSELTLCASSPRVHSVNMRVIRIIITISIVIVTITIITTTIT